MKALTVLPLRKLDKAVTLEIELQVTREFRARAWVAKQLFRLACWALGMKCNVDILK